ncbi:MAG: NfeD family protein [Phycisphaerales bacterium]|jgi:membrane-bound ClpP family serine protease|nr:NfeD family protein [Phycisphaerales bacterium]
MDPLLLWGLGLLAAGVLLVVVELFVPSAGILAIVSAVTAIAGVVCLFRYDTTWGLIGGLFLVVGGPTIAAFGLKIWPNTPIGRRMLHGEGGEDLQARTEERLRGQREELARLVGLEGEAVTDLRPVGTARIDGRRMDAVADGAIIGAGTRVRVVSIGDNGEVKVRELT